MRQEERSILLDIPGYESWKTIDPITIGWSPDQKYYIKDIQAHQFLLRISEGSSFKKEFLIYSKLEELNLLDDIAPKMIDSGMCNSGKNTYRLFTWIEGKEFNELIGGLSKKDQYQYGLKAGLLLKEINKIKPPKDHPSWKAHYGQKIDAKLDLYQKCQINLDKEEVLLSYISNYKNLIVDRPSCFQHGDYHIGNMLMTPKKELAVIDFDRMDFGDPWEEFNRITWSASISPAFACGQINGYFDHLVPEEFFKLLGLYMCVNQLGSIPWAEGYGEKEIATAIEKTKEVLDWFDDFKQVQPKWYYKN